MPDPASDPSPLRAAVCGYGALGHVHADNLAALSGVDVVAVCDIRPGQFQPADAAFNVNPAGERRFDVRQARTCTDWRELLRQERLDLLVIALPTDLHAEVAIAALEAGVHVFCEKPMALDAAQAGRMAATAARTGRRLMIGQCLRFWPEYEELLRMITAREHGALRVVRMSRTGAYSAWSAEGWMNDHRRSGGAILDLHLHDLDWALHALGRPRALLATGQTGRSGGIDEITAVLDYGGHQAVLTGSWMHHAFRMGFEAVFDDATVSWASGQAMTVQRRDVPPATIAVEQGSGYRRELDYLCGCIRAGTEPTRCLPRDTAVTVEMVEAERRSIETRTWITL